jgi:hypothetical protein
MSGGEEADAGVVGVDVGEGAVGDVAEETLTQGLWEVG